LPGNGNKPNPKVTGLVRAADRGLGPLGPLPSREIQELWFASVRKTWHTLALVPAQNGRSVLPLAHALAVMGRFHRGAALRVIPTEGMGLDEIADLTLGSVNSHARNEGGRILVLEPISVNPFGTAIALTADAAILCLEYGLSTLDDARRTLDQIGRERFVGATALQL
jgi:hypothetical protein